MSDFLINCYYLRTVLLVSFGLGILIFVASSFLAPSFFNFDKYSAYECGFEPFEDARSKFDVRFYLVGLLFIIFDLEVAFLFPVINLALSASGMFFLVAFLTVLTLGFVYEWSKGALSWS